MLRFAVIALGLLWLAGGARAQVDSSLAAPSSRVALLPFANLAEDPEAAGQVMAQARSELEKSKVDLADSGSVAEILRKHRIRNTSELSQADAQALAQEASVRYLLLGSIDRYSQSDSAAEVAFSARLLDVTTATIVWANSVVEHGDPRLGVLGLGAHHAATLTARATRTLFHGFRYGPQPKAKTVQSIRMKGQNPAERPCRKIMLVTFGNETDTHFAGSLFANELLSELLKRGFSVVDPGRVREAMLESKDLMQGEISRELLAKCSRDLGADFVLTGTVSRFESERGPLFDEPAAAFEARLIDAKRGDVVWAKTYSREGKDSSWIFNIGYVHGLAMLSQRMSHQLAWDLPVRRARSAAPQPSLAEGGQ